MKTLLILNIIFATSLEIKLKVFIFFNLQRGSDELLSQAAVMAPASDNNNQDLATKKAKLETNSTVLGGVGKCQFDNCNKLYWKKDCTDDIVMWFT